MPTTANAGSETIKWITENSPFSANGTIALGATLVAAPLIYLLTRGSLGKRTLKWPRCALNPDEFVKCKLISVTKVSHNAAMYRFKLPRKESLNLPIGKHVSLRATVGGRQAVRSYTPISPPTSVGHFDLLIKTYPSGTVSKYVSEMQLGEYIDVKGPKGNFEYAPNMFKAVGMIAGGTGITPMFQVIRHIMENPKDKTKVSFIYANVNEDDILLRPELEHLAAQHPDRLTLHFTLDNPSAGWTQGKGFVTTEMIKEFCPPPVPGETKVLLCGPPPMVASMSAHLDLLGYGKMSTQATAQDTLVYKF